MDKYLIGYTNYGMEHFNNVKMVDVQDESEIVGLLKTSLKLGLLEHFENDGTKISSEALNTIFDDYAKQIHNGIELIHEDGDLYIEAAAKFHKLTDEQYQKLQEFKSDEDFVPDMNGWVETDLDCLVDEL